MKILHTISGRGLGGPKTVFLAYHEIFKTLNCQPIIVLRHASEIDQLITSNDPKYYINYRRILPPALQPQAIQAMRSVVAKEAPDVIWVHKPIDAYIWRYACPHAVIVLMVHGFQKKYLDCADHLIAVSPVVLNYIQLQNYKSVTLITNFLSREMDPTPKHIIPNAVPRIGAFGYFRKKKGFTDFFHALKLLKVKNNVRPFEVHIWGYGTLKPVLKILKWFYQLTNVIMHPWTRHAAEQMKDLDIVVVPSRSESFGLVVIEAMSQGALVIATRSGGPDSIIEDKKTGLLVDIRNPEQLAEVLQLVINNLADYTLIRNQGRVEAAKYSQPAIVSQVQNFLSSMRKSVVI